MVEQNKMKALLTIMLLYQWFSSGAMAQSNNASKSVAAEAIRFGL
jgi:hypothetical protein